MGVGCRSGLLCLRNLQRHALTFDDLHSRTSFNAIRKKPKLDQHAQRCWAVYTCLDCNTTFEGTNYRAHTSCISEDQKYQKSVYKAPKPKGQQQKPAAAPSPAPAPAPTLPAAPTPAPTPVVDSTPNTNGKRPAETTDAAAPSSAKKSKKADAMEATNGDAAAAVADSAEDAKKAKKLAKKEKKAKKAAEAEAAASAQASASSGDDEDVAAPTQPQADIVVQPDLEKVAAAALALSVPSPSASTSDATLNAHPTATTASSGEGAATVYAYLAAILPGLLETSRSLAALQAIVLEQAVAAGWSKEETEKAFGEGIWVGGNKPKKMLMLNFEGPKPRKSKK
ncbi:hypothetical protein MNV49_006808 [Pseudohyphozyma bogoriensis]|nr:hypothetical protein MNV49_006808 [Pseudohyphozyma bogoriensis]